MRDYALLAKSFRHCAEKRECASCPMYVKDKKCPDFEVRKLAADAIEELLGQHEADAKEIEWLKKRVQDLPKPPRWISVEDELPHYLDHVLCVNKYGIQMVGYLTDYKEGGFRCESGMDSCDYITHWMPLPKAPEPPTKGVE